MSNVGKDYNALDSKGRLDVDGASVERPKGVGEGNYTFENKIIDVYNIIKDRLPDYDPFNTNSNGFAKILIETAGGKIDLPINGYGSSIKRYQEIYQQYLQEKKKEEEEKRREKRQK